MYTHVISLLCQLRRSRSNDIRAAISTPHTQILLSTTVLHYKDLVILEEIADSRTGAVNIQDLYTRPSYSVRK